MHDSMHILDQLRERGYEPQEDARPDEGWFDRQSGTDGKILRVVLTDEGAAQLFGFDRYMCLEWDAEFSASIPPSVFLAALDAAEREAGGQEDERHTFTRLQLIDALTRLEVYPATLPGRERPVVVADSMAGALIEALAGEPQPLVCGCCIDNECECEGAQLRP